MKDAVLRLALREQRDGVTVLGARAELPGGAELIYETRTGALLRVGGDVVSAFDREHATAVVPQRENAEITLEVEDASLPTNALPAGPGLKWWWLNRRKRQRPSLAVRVRAVEPGPPSPAPAGAWPAIGHAHLDVAWLWTYAEAARKAARTFAIAEQLLQRFPEFVFTQSQPQLYDFVAREDPAFAGRIAALVRAGRIDAGVAALWVESDCNLPSGESLLRQMLYARAFCRERFGMVPQVAWLPDTFGFCNTLPSLLAHAGIPYFVTTKLEWNDTTRFPHKQFRWRGPDGSEVTAALMQAYEGDVSAARVDAARLRNEPVIAGYGDGGGGVTPAMVEQARERAHWIAPVEWMQQLEARKASLPVHADELYLEYHRGTYTTHHDVKARNAALERTLHAVEERLAWCVAVRAPREMIAALCDRVDDVWRLVLRNQFHDVLPGTSVPEVYADVHEEYDEAQSALEAVLSATRNILPRGREPSLRARCAPVAQPDGMYRFENPHVRAIVNGAGVLLELHEPGSPNCVSSANVLGLFADKPRKWEAWNIDAGYEKKPLRLRAGAATIEDGALCVPFRTASSTLTMRLSLRADEPFLRVDLDADWQDRRALLRVEHRLALTTDRARFGTPHGTIERSALQDTPERRARYEVPGQRFASVRDGNGGFVQFALDTYGWNARVLPEGGIALGHSLLRGTAWPDPDADRGAHALRLAYAPLRDRSTGAIEALWERFAHEPRVRLFRSDDAAVAVAACKPALDRDGVILRVRECDGAARTARIRSAGRVRAVEPCSGLEEPASAEAVCVEGEELVFSLSAHALRSFRVRFA